MAAPTSKMTTLRPELATFEMLDMEMNRRGYVGLRILPPFQVNVPFGTFGIIKMASLLANAGAVTRRTSTGGYMRGKYEFEDRSYQTKENGWEETIDEREAKMYANIFDQEVIATARAWEHVLNSLEIRILNAAVGSTVTGGRTTAAAGVWTNPALGKPIDDIFNAAEAVYLRTGVWPRTVAMSRRAFRNARRTDQVKAEIIASGAGSPADQKRVTPSMLADVLDVDEVIIADSIKNNANRGQAASIGSVFPESQVLVTRTASTNDFKEPCLGRTFHWGGDGSVIQGDGLIGVVEDYEEPQTRKKVIRVRHETAEFILYPEMAQVVTGVR